MCRNNSSKRLLRRASTRATPPASPRGRRGARSPSPSPSMPAVGGGGGGGGGGGMVRSDSTVSSMSSYRPRSSPAGLFSYTGKYLAD